MLGFLAVASGYDRRPEGDPPAASNQLYSRRFSARDLSRTEPPNRLCGLHRSQAWRGTICSADHSAVGNGVIATWEDFADNVPNNKRHLEQVCLNCKPIRSIQRSFRNFRQPEEGPRSWQRLLYLPTIPEKPQIPICQFSLILL